jgi:cytidyltransferase-like protein
LKRILIAGSFDDFRSAHARLLQEAHRLGAVHVLLWSDRVVAAITGSAPKFPEAERFYLVRTNRYVTEVIVVDEIDTEPQSGFSPSEALIGAIEPDIWLDTEENRGRAVFCSRHGLEFRVLDEGKMAGFPQHEAVPARRGNRNAAVTAKKVVATGCFDWFHSGHVRFFEESSAYGDLFVVVGNDENIRLLKGEGHPLFPQAERCYLVGSVRFVKAAVVSTGSGWMDAEPEILSLKPEIYVVNEDGDKPEKRAFCREHNIKYLVLKRIPKDGLARRSSTVLRGF